jgi:hypothetical protein
LHGQSALARYTAMRLTTDERALLTRATTHAVATVATEIRHAADSAASAGWFLLREAATLEKHVSTSMVKAPQDLREQIAVSSMNLDEHRSEMLRLGRTASSYSSLLNELELLHLEPTAGLSVEAAAAAISALSRSYKLNRERAALYGAEVTCSLLIATDEAELRSIALALAAPNADLCVSLMRQCPTSLFLDVCRAARSF